MAIVVVLIFVVTGVLMGFGVHQISLYGKGRGDGHRRNHKLLMRSAFFSVLLGVAIIEFFIQTGSVQLFHLLVAIPFLLLLGVLAWYGDGDRWRELHRALGRICFVLYFLTFFSGLAMLFD